jgi:hypothetical protein
LQDKAAHLAVSGRFELDSFGAHFDYGIAVSLFTHLPMNYIIRCLVQVRRTLVLANHSVDVVFVSSVFPSTPVSCSRGDLLSGLVINEPIHPIAGALRLRMHQLLSSPIQIGECKQGKYLCCVLFEAYVAHLGIATQVLSNTCSQKTHPCFDINILPSIVCVTMPLYFASNEH